MFFRVLFWGVLLGVLLTGISAEDEPKEVKGILGENATFPLQSPKPFGAVFWKRNGMQVATLRRETPCNITLLRAYIGRIVTTSEDCSSLRVIDVREEDSAEYRAEFMRQDLLDTLYTQIFTLKVYKRLSEADLDVVCKEEIRKDGNKTLLLNCSVGKWGDGVDFSWNSPGQKDTTSSSLVLPNTQDDQNVTCMAKNPIGAASRTVSLKQACAAGEQPTRPTTVADPENDSHSSPPQSTVIAITVVLMLLAMIAAVVVAVWKRRRNKAVGKELITPSSNSGPKDFKSEYAEIQNEIPDVEMGSPQQGRGSGAHKEMPTTVYAHIQHPEKTPLQTDDEKIQREKRRAAERSKKTIYSEISGGDMKETNQEDIKTIYDTVKLPKPQNLPEPPEASEYNKIL